MSNKRLMAFQKTGFKCGYCGCDLDADNGVVDHIIAKRNGGSNDLDNLMASCRPCNASKGYKSLEEYRIWVQWKDIRETQAFSIYQLIWMLENTDLSKRHQKEEHKFYFEVSA